MNTDTQPWKMSLVTECDCYDTRHLVQFILFTGVDVKDEAELYIAVQLNPYLPLWRRCWLGLRYVLGLQAPGGHWDSGGISPESAEKLIVLCREFLRHRGKENVTTTVRNTIGQSEGSSCTGGKSMTTVTILESTCDRCHRMERHPEYPGGLPDGWKRAYLERTMSPTIRKDLCPSCAAVVEDALRPLEEGYKAARGCIKVEETAEKP